MSCIFCKISSGEIPSYKLYENDEFVVILDRFPSCVGHSLVIPKTHAEDIFDIDSGLAGRAYALAAETAGKIKAALGCDGVNILQNNGVAAGQSVQHFHIHIIPRYNGDDVKIGWKPQEPSDEEMENILNKIK